MRKLLALIVAMLASCAPTAPVLAGDPMQLTILFTPLSPKGWAVSTILVRQYPNLMAYACFAKKADEEFVTCLYTSTDKEAPPVAITETVRRWTFT